jgi:hypothetical protein
MELYTFLVTQPDGSAIPPFMSAQIIAATTKQYLSIQTNSYLDVGKYYLKAVIQKYSCVEDVYFSVVINTPPIISFAPTITAYINSA